MAKLTVSERKKRKRIKTRVIDIAQQEANTSKPYHATIGRRRRIHGDDAQFAASKECGTGLGRYLHSLERSGDITRQESNSLLDVAQRFQIAVTDYDKEIIGAPSPNPRAINMMAVGGLSTRVVDQQSVDRITAKYMSIRGAIDWENDGPQIWRVLRKACIEDEPLESWPPLMCTRLMKGLRIVAKVA